jgi:hypothetical protein
MSTPPLYVPIIPEAEREIHYKNMLTGKNTEQGSIALCYYPLYCPRPLEAGEG